MVLRISMGQVAHRASIHRDSKVNIHPPVDRCIHPTGHRNPAKEGQPLRRRVQPHRHPPIRTEAMAVVRTLHRHSSDPMVSNRRQSVPDRRRHPRPDHRVLPVNHRSAGHPDSNLRLPSPRAKDTLRRRNHPSNRTTTGQISLTNQGGIQILRRINNRTRPTNSDRRCILADGREVPVSTVDSIPRRDPSNSGEPTTDPVRAVHPVRQVVHRELPERRTSGVPTPIGTLRISNRRIRLINRLSSNPGPRCHRHHKARRCDHRSGVASRSHRCNRREWPAVCHRLRNHRVRPVLQRVRVPSWLVQRLAVVHRRLRVPHLKSAPNRCPRHRSLRRVALHRSGTLYSQRIVLNPQRRCCTKGSGSASSTLAKRTPGGYSWHFGLDCSWRVPGRWMC